MQAQARNYDGWIGHDVYDAEGNKVGEIKDIYYDDVTQRPEWLAVKTGMFGGANTFIPIQGSSVYGEDDLQVAYTKDFIKAAPNIDADGSMTPAQERELWQYFEYDYDVTTKKDHFGYGTTYDKNRVDKDFDAGWRQDWKRGDQARMTEQPRMTEREGEVIAEATATNETVVKQTQPETVRLRKYVWTENVPVQREEVRVESESESTRNQSGTTQTRPPRNA